MTLALCSILLRTTYAVDVLEIGKARLYDKNPGSPQSHTQTSSSCGELGDVGKCYGCVVCGPFDVASILKYYYYQKYWSLEQSVGWKERLHVCNNYSESLTQPIKALFHLCMFLLDRNISMKS